MRYYPRFPRVIPHKEIDHPRVTHPYATVLMDCSTFSFDLHVLSAPPALILSRDQTLILSCEMFVAPVEPKVQITNPPRVFPAAGTDEVISASNQIVKDPCRPPLTSKDVKNTSWPRNLRDPIRPKAQGLFTPEPDR